ncbi:hypothetical protein ACN077_20545 [Clostridium chromiireducens]|uniref:hypothetical protein n=1 Tax=Clostridium chromiireducens TaxID=225345 RepID=UPI003AF56031
MENSKIEDGVIDNGKEMIKDKVKGLNIFTVFHVAWLIEIYYLGLNSLLNNGVIKERIASNRFTSFRRVI